MTGNRWMGFTRMILENGLFVYVFLFKMYVESSYMGWNKSSLTCHIGALLYPFWNDLCTILSKKN